MKFDLTSSDVGAFEASHVSNESIGVVDIGHASVRSIVLVSTVARATRSMSDLVRARLHLSSKSLICEHTVNIIT